MTVQTLNKTDSKELVSRLEQLPERFRFQMIGYLERVEEEAKKEAYFNPQQMKRLRHSIEQAQNGQIVTKTLAELEAMESD